MLIGAHVSIRGGVRNAVDNALAIGADAFQTHPTPAVMWRPLRLDEEMVDAYLRKYSSAGKRGHYQHSVYLINLSTPKEQLPGEEHRGPDLVNINRIRECAGLAARVVEPVAAG
jgi:deoxyribonuclease-4